MADKTKAELEGELAAALEENELLKSAGNHDLSWYQKEINKLTSDNGDYVAEIKALKQKIANQVTEKEVITADRKREESAALRPFNQSEHTRFRLRERPIMRDIFGDVINPVFDAGVELQDYSGPVQLPVGVVIEMAQSIGMLTIEQAKELRDELTASTIKNEQAAILGTELTSGISLLVDQFYADLADITVAFGVDSKAESAESESGTVVAESSDSEPAKDSGQADGDNSGEKPDGVSDATGNASGESDDGGSSLDKLIGKL